MSRKLNARERYLLTAVPMLSVLIVYVFAFYRPQQAILADTTRRLQEAQKDLITARQVQAKRAELAHKQEQVRIEKGELAELDGRPTILYAGVVPTSRDDGEAGALAKVSRILRDRSIVVVTSARVPDGEVGALMPADLRETSKRMSAAVKGVGGGGPPTVWRLDLVGSFVNVRDALDALAVTDTLIVPVGISMEPAREDETAHQWKLWIWM